MKKNSSIPHWLVALFSVATLISCSSNKYDNNEEVLAQIDELKVTEAHFLSAFKRNYYRTGQTLSPSYENKSSVLASEFNVYVLAAYAKEQGLNNTLEVKNRKEMIKRRVLNHEYLERSILSGIEISEQEIEQMFVKFNTQLRASHVFAPSKEKADSLYSELLAGKSFEQIAANEFKNPKLANNGGDLGFFTVDEMDVAFEQKAFEMEVGQISPPVRTAQGYSIIKLTDKFIRPVLTEYEFASKKDQFAFFAEKQKKELKTRVHLDEFLNDVKLNESEIKRLWSKISINYGNFNSLETEFIKTLFEGNAIISKYKGFQLGSDEFKEELYFTPSENLNNVRDLSTFKNLIKGITYRKYLYAEAIKLGLEKKADIQSSITQTYLSFLAQSAEEKLKEQIRISESELRELYFKETERFVKPLEVDLSRIVLDDENKAVFVRKKLIEGASFEQMVQNYSVKNEERLSGGRLGLSFAHSFGTLTPKLSKLTEGEISEVLQYQNGEYHIYKLNDRVEPRQLSFSESIQLAERILIQQKFKRLRSKTIEEVKKRRNAFINERKLKELSVQI